MRTTRRLTRISLVAAASLIGIVCLFANDNWSPERNTLITQADARIGRPFTPGSFAGVARRTTRRHVRRGVYYGAAGLGAGAAYYGSRGYYGSGCYRSRNRYGRLITVCR